MNDLQELALNKYPVGSQIDGAIGQSHFSDT